jgi:DNA-binding LacI/PurR family transcriptional regulator/signal transduction histidine kinase
VQGSSPRRPTLAFLLDNLFDGFEEALWRSVVSTARDQDVNLLCYLGGSLLLPDGTSSRPTVASYPGGVRYPRWGRNAVFDLVHPRNVDAIIGLSNSVGSFIGDEALERFYARYAPLPILSVCRPLAGYPSLVVGNEAGIGQLMDHLVVHHGRRRIAFIRGPETNTDAEVRFKAYREALERHGIPFDPAYALPGDFERTSGPRAVKILLDDRRLRPDALVAANDYMALYAIPELTRRGIDVPGDMALAGFDDILDASSAIPSLTTVRQPLHEIGQVAVHRALALLRGEPVPALETFPSQLVVRRSCGCLPALGAWRDPVERALDAGPASPREMAEAIRRAAPELADRLGAAEWAEELARDLLRGVEGAPDAFLGTLERLVVRGLASGVNPLLFHDVLHVALENARERTGSGDGSRLALLAESAFRMVGSMATHAQTALRIRADEETTILRRIFLPGHLSDDDFRKVLLGELPTLDIRSFYLARFLDLEGRSAELRAHYDQSGHFQAVPEGEPFESAHLLPCGFRPPARHAHAVVPLHYIGERIGYAVCEIGSMNPGGYETLSTQMSTVLKVGSLLAEVRRQASGLEEMVEARTRELREAQRQLLEVAHQTGMAEVAVGVLHNVGNLLNSVSICAEQIASYASSPHADGLRKVAELMASQRDDLAGFFSRDPRAALLPGYLEKISAELAQDRTRSRDEAQLLLEKVAVIRDTIRALQDLAREGHQAILRDHVELHGVLDVVLEIQAPLLIRYGVVLRKELSDSVPVLVTERAKLIHVLVNLVKNAVEAMRKTPEGARSLTVEAALDGAGLVRIAISDTGEGIAPQDLDRIFSFGFTTKQDGHGFGLHTCALYAGQLGGSLKVHSRGTGRGATFTLVIPLELAQA